MKERNGDNLPLDCARMAVCEMLEEEEQLFTSCVCVCVGERESPGLCIIGSCP